MAPASCGSLVIPIATRTMSVTGPDARRRADRERQAQEDSAERARENEERTHDFEERYAVEHEQHVERERAKRADGS
jgi:hypothetical protein